MRNHLGSITEITGIYQNTVKSYDYDAYGKILGESGWLGHNPFTYTARECHSRSGLYYYRARWYSPQIGRFMSQDPIGFAGGMNLYAYVGNNPINLIDPYGLESIILEENDDFSWSVAMDQYIGRSRDPILVPITKVYPKDGLGASDFDQNGETVVDTNGPSGNVTFYIKDGRVYAKSDIFNFDKKPYGVRDPNGFPYWKEWAVRLGRGIPGKSYRIYFEGSMPLKEGGCM